jgi:L-ascorbate metabolism protein UlaG (beta-lactamase superfamily)
VFAAALAVVLLAGCGHVAGGFDFANPGCGPYRDTGSDQVEVHYLGSGGAAIRWRGDAILLGPSFSNPGILRAGFLRGKADLPRIQTALAGCGTGDVRAIFAGHSHYDHIGDLPVVCDTFIPDVPVFVNATGANILHSESALAGRLNVLAAGSVIPVGRSMRIRAVASGHAPQLCKWNIALCHYGGGEVADAWTTPAAKRRLKAMRGGQAFAFVIELLGESGETRYRIYYNDAAAASPFGQTEGPFDLAILTMAQWNWVRDYPRDLLAVLRPRHVLVSHWDNFFRRDAQRWTFVPWLTDASAARFLKIVTRHAGNDGPPVNAVCGARTEQWTMPVPGSSLLFHVR